MRETGIFIYGLIALACYFSCSISMNSQETSKVLGKTDTADNFSNICQKIAGSWLTYRNKKGAGNRICDGVPCGRGMGLLELKCDNGKLTGRQFLRINSTVSPPEISWADITVNWKEENLILQYKDSCLISYKILEVEENKMLGEFSAESCKEPDWLPYHEGDFTAIRDLKENK